MPLDCPDKDDILRTLICHPFEYVDGEAERECGAAAPGNENNLVKLHGVRECAIRAVDRGPESGTWMSRRVFVEVTGEPVAGLDCELDR